MQLQLSCNSIDVLPDEIGNLIKLKKLSLAENELKALPSTMSKMKDLAVLDVSQNQIRELPRELSMWNRMLLQGHLCSFLLIHIHLLFPSTLRHSMIICRIPAQMMCEKKAGLLIAHKYMLGT